MIRRIYLECRVAEEAFAQFWATRLTNLYPSGNRHEDHERLIKRQSELTAGGMAASKAFEKASKEILSGK